MTYLIIISGAPGSGKTTMCKMLQKRLDCPFIDFGDIRNFHLDPKWKKANKKEEQMSFENLVFILKNYIRYGYKNVIVNDLQDFRVQQIPRIFAKNKFKIFSLMVKYDKVLKKRVLGPRDSGFKNYEAAIARNRKLIKRKPVKNEYKIDNTHNNPKKTFDIILKMLK